jgi:hypothetical protein
MITLCIRYRFIPECLAGVREYFETEQKVIERSGGKVVGYFLPTDFAGPTDEAIGLIDLPSMAAYEEYRARLTQDPDHKANVTRLEQSGARAAMDRSLILRVQPRS